MRSVLRIIEKIVVMFITGAAIAFLFAMIVAPGYDEGESGQKQQTQQESIAKWATWDGESEVPRAYAIVYVEKIVRSEYLSGMGEVYGLVRNASPNDFSYIQVSVGVYVDNTKVGSCFANQSHLPARTNWQFTGTCTGLPSSAFQYRVEEVSYW